jgi:hypothetical protein
MGECSRGGSLILLLSLSSYIYMDVRGEVLSAFLCIIDIYSHWKHQFFLTDRGVYISAFVHSGR